MPLIVGWMPCTTRSSVAPGAMAPEQFDLSMIERVDIGGAKFGKGVALRVTGQLPYHSAIHPLSDL
jgi:hypothetical protein